jgi:hypothetical protein
VKNILYTLLSEKYSVVATPESFNTPMGLAKTVLSPDFDRKQIFIAEMGARKHGDIAELCNLIHPDYAVFTGVCEQHIQGFGSVENVWAEKSEVLKCGAKKVFCGAGLTPYVEAEFVDKIGENIFVDEADFELDTGAAATSFKMKLYGETIEFKSKRKHDPEIEVACQYRPISEPFQATQGSFEEWLVERYCFYTLNSSGVPLRCDILHEPWILQEAEAEFSKNSVLSKQGIDINDEMPIFHFAKKIEVRSWPLVHHFTNRFST